jgi:hypothetical protein
MNTSVTLDNLIAKLDTIEVFTGALGVDVHPLCYEEEFEDEISL